MVLLPIGTWRRIDLIPRGMGHILVFFERGDIICKILFGCTPSYKYKLFFLVVPVKC